MVGPWIHPWGIPMGIAHGDSPLGFSLGIPHAASDAVRTWDFPMGFPHGLPMEIWDSAGVLIEVGIGKLGML